VLHRPLLQVLLHLLPLRPLAQMLVRRLLLQQRPQRPSRMVERAWPPQLPARLRTLRPCLEHRQRRQRLLALPQRVLVRPARRLQGARPQVLLPVQR
jgi:hypothetical protein